MKRSIVIKDDIPLLFPYIIMRNQKSILAQFLTIYHTKHKFIIISHKVEDISEKDFFY